MLSRRPAALILTRLVRLQSQRRPSKRSRRLCILPLARNHPYPLQNHSRLIQTRPIPLPAAPNPVRRPSRQVRVPRVLRQLFLQLYKPALPPPVQQMMHRLRLRPGPPIRKQPLLIRDQGRRRSRDRWSPAHRLRLPPAPQPAGLQMLRPAQPGRFSQPRLRSCE